MNVCKVCTGKGVEIIYTGLSGSEATREETCTTCNGTGLQQD